MYDENSLLPPSAPSLIIVQTEIDSLFVYTVTLSPVWKITILLQYGDKNSLNLKYVERQIIMCE